MQKYIDEFFDIIERTAKGALVYVFFLALLYLADRRLGPDMETLRKISGPEAAKAFFYANRAKFLFYAFLSFFISAYAGMGYWGCVMGKGKAAFRDFFLNANRMFLRSLSGYLAEGFLPFLTLPFAFFASLLIPRFPVISVFFMAFFVFTVWFSFRIVFWEPLMYSGNLSGWEAVKASFAVTKGSFSRVFYFVLLPVFLLNLIGGRVTGSFLRHAFIFLNVFLLPVAVTAAVYMLFRRLGPPRSEPAVPPAPENKE